MLVVLSLAHYATLYLPVCVCYSESHTFTMSCPASKGFIYLTIFVFIPEILKDVPGNMVH